MDILKPQWPVTEGELSGEFERIRLSQNDDGTFTAFVPLRLPNTGEAGDARAIDVSVPLTISSETAKASKGRRRLMVKVAIPYTAVNPLAADPTMTANLLDSSRSGGELSAHVVLSTPSACETDFKGNSGSLCQRGASAQVAFVTRLLAALLGDQFLGLGGQGSALSSSSLDTNASDIPKIAYGDETTELDSGTYLLEGESNVKPLIVTKISGYSNPGFDLSNLGGGVEKLLDNPVTRGLQGLKPLTDSTNRCIPTTVAWINPGE